MEGLSNPGQLIQRLSLLVNEYEINLVSARADRFEASFNRSLRSQQDEAFLESLRADQEKERRREEQRMAEEAERRRLEEVSYKRLMYLLSLDLLLFMPICLC